MEVAPVAADRLVVPRGNEIDVDSRSRGGGRVQAPAHPRLTYRPELDAIRGVAVLLVLFQHFGLTGVGPENHRAGQVGVTLFFVLSGYLITSLLLAERRSSGTVSLSRFYVRRFRRLVPALAFMVTIVAIAGVAGAYLPALSYTTNIFVVAGGEPGAMLHTWTLAIEEQFYLVWPALFLLLAPRPRLMIAALIIGIPIAAAAWPVTGILQRADALGLGALLAVGALRVPSWVGAAGWVGVLACALVPGDVDTPLLVLATLSAAAVVAAPGRIAAPSLVRLGGISYAVYLWSYPIATVVQPLQDKVPRIEAVAWTMAGIVACLAMAVVSGRWVERRWRIPRSHAPDPAAEGLPAAAAA